MVLVFAFDTTFAALANKSEVGGRKSEVESRKSEVRSRKSEVGSRKSEVGSRKSEEVSSFTQSEVEVRSQKSKSEVRSPKSEEGSRKSKVGSRKSLLDFRSQCFFTSKIKDREEGIVIYSFLSDVGSISRELMV